MHVPPKRLASACAACVLLLSLSPVRCEVAEDASAAQKEDDDLDLGDLDSDDEDEDDVQGESPEPADFDKDMPEEQRLVRMNVCLAGASARMQSNAEAVSGLAMQLVNQRQGMSMEQATNSVFFTWMMTCYMNIADEDAKAAGEGNAEALKDVNLYEPSAQNQHNAQTASRRQWDFLVSVVKEHMAKVDAAKERQDRKSQSEPQRSGKSPPEQEPTAAPGSGSKASILLLVVVFGIIGLVIMFLMRKEQEDREEKEKRKSKKDKKKNH